MDLGFIITSGILNGLIWCLMCLGVYISYRILDCADLSVEGTFPLGACVAAWLIYVKVPPVLATLLAAIIGLGAGAITGLLHTKLKIPAILSGIITMTGLYTINMVVLGFTSSTSSTKNTIPIQSSIFDFFRNSLMSSRTIDVGEFKSKAILVLIILTLIVLMFNIVKYFLDKEGFKKNKVNMIISSTIIGLFIILLGLNIISNSFTISFKTFVGNNANYIAVIGLSLVVVLAVYGIIYWFFGTEIGMSVRATGNNQRMSKAQGINTTGMIILGLAISNGLVALSGTIFAQNLGNANVEMGRGVIVIGLASIILGEVIFGRRSFKRSLISVVVGSTLYYFLNAIAIELNVVNYLKLVSAVLIVVILAIPTIKSKFKAKNIASLTNQGGESHA